MTVLPSVTGKDLVAALKKAGFEVVRIKGSQRSGYFRETAND
jgi:predicted RNA binding protein YcfA (HicA-like mRNA interferase family)